MLQKYHIGEEGGRGNIYGRTSRAHSRSLSLSHSLSLSLCADRGGAVVSLARVNKLAFKEATSTEGGGEDLARHIIASGAAQTNLDLKVAEGYIHGVLNGVLS